MRLYSIFYITASTFTYCVKTPNNLRKNKVQIRRNVVTDTDDKKKGGDTEYVNLEAGLWKTKYHVDMQSKQWKAAAVSFHNGRQLSLIHI